MNDNTEINELVKAINRGDYDAAETWSHRYDAKAMGHALAGLFSIGCFIWGFVLVTWVFA